MISQQGEGKRAGEIHYSSDFPVWTTPCGTVGPATDRWEYVTCTECKKLKQTDERLASPSKRGTP
jgi:hypothetical protein